MDEKYIGIAEGLHDALLPVRPVLTSTKLARVRRDHNNRSQQNKQVSASHLKETLDEMCLPGSKRRSNQWFVCPTQGRKDGANWKDLAELLKRDNLDRLIVIPKSHAFFDPTSYKQATKHGPVLPLWQRKTEHNKTFYQCLMQRLQEEVDPQHPFVAWSYMIGSERYVGTPIDNWMGQLVARSRLIEVEGDYARVESSGETYFVKIPSLSEDKVHKVVVNNVTLLRKGKRPNQRECAESFALEYGEHDCWKTTDGRLKHKGRKPPRSAFDPDNTFRIQEYVSGERVECFHRDAAVKIGRQHYSEKGLVMPRHGPDITPLQERMLINAIQNVVVERPVSSHNDGISRFTPLPQAYLSRIWFAMTALGYR